MHDPNTCHACATITLRHAAGGTLDPNATLDPSLRVRSSFVRQSDEAVAAFFARLEALDLRDAVVAAVDGAVAGRLLAIPTSVEEDFRDAYRRAASVRDVPAAGGRS